MPHNRKTYTRSEQFTGAARIVVAGLIWGLIPVFLRLSDGSTTVKIWTRVLAAAVVMFGYMALRGRVGEIRKLGRQRILMVMSQGVILGVNWMFFLNALDGAGSVALAELLGYTSPVLVALLAPMVLKERFDARVLISIALAIAGFTTMLAPGGFSLQGEAGVRALWGLCSALTIATLNLRAKKIVQGIPGDVFLFLEHSTAAALLTPFALYLIAVGKGPTTSVSWIALIGGLGVLCTVVAGLVHLEGFRRIRVDHSAVLCYTEPVSAILFTAALPFAAEVVPVLKAAIPAHPEVMGPWTIVGGALIVAAGVFIIRLQTSPEVEPLAQLELAPVVIMDETNRS